MVPISTFLIIYLHHHCACYLMPLMDLIPWGMSILILMVSSRSRGACRHAPESKDDADEITVVPDIT